MLLVFALDVVTFTELVVLVTDFVVYATTVVFTGSVAVTVFVVAKRQDLPAIEIRQLVVLLVEVESKRNSERESANSFIV